MTNDLTTLNAAALKKIARDQGLEFSPMASAPQMLKILADAGVTAAPSETPKSEAKVASTTVKTPKAAKSEKVETADEGNDEAEVAEFPRGTYTVQEKVTIAGVDYKKGDVISGINSDTAETLQRNGTIK